MSKIRGVVTFFRRLGLFLLFLLVVVGYFSPVGLYAKKRVETGNGELITTQDWAWFSAGIIYCALGWTVLIILLIFLIRRAREKRPTS